MNVWSGEREIEKLLTKFKMFPNYKTIRKKFLFIPYSIKVKDGWEFVGDVKKCSKLINGKVFDTWFVHKICGNGLAVGKEGNDTFRFCPICMKKIID